MPDQDALPYVPMRLLGNRMMCRECGDLIKVEEVGKLDGCPSVPCNVRIGRRGVLVPVHVEAGHT